MEWLAWGAYMEDDDAPRVALLDVLRCANHFYSLLHVPLSLTDDTELPRLLPSPRTDSFVWGSDPTILGPHLAGQSAGYNYYTWQAARDKELDSLTRTTKSSRESALVECLYSLGHVLHLNQDLSSPDHVRNDEHLPNGKPWFEKYGLDEYYTKSKNAGTLAQTFPTRPRGWLSWRDAGFLKLEDFWNRKKYTGNSTALNKDRFAVPGTSTAGDQLGLGEFSNGNFLGEDATYRELLKPGSGDYTLHYFPFPSLFTSTRFLKDIGTISLQGHLWGASTELITFKNGLQGKRPYMKKVADGISVNKHSVLLYNGVKHANLPRLKKMISIGDNEVLTNYHLILIPKAIEYSAGILDYFFRGKLEVVSVVWNGSQYTITVRNQSGQELVNGGNFFVLKDEANGNRSFVTSQDGVSLTQNVSDGNTWQFTFPGPQVAEPTQFILVYKGTIGLTGGDPSDPTDANIAIAAKNFTISPPPCVPITSLQWTVPFPDTGVTSFDYTGSTITFSAAGTSTEIGDMVRYSVAFESPGGCYLLFGFNLAGDSGIDPFAGIGFDIYLDGVPIEQIQAPGYGPWSRTGVTPTDWPLSPGSHIITVGAYATELLEIHGTLTFSTSP